MKFLITGGAGFLGINLAERLIKKNHKVRILDMRDKPKLAEGIEYIKGDIRDYSLVNEATKGIDVVFNLASLLPCSRAGNMFYKVNVGGTKNVIIASNEYKVKKIVHISTSIVYGKPKVMPCSEEERVAPVGNYGRSKVVAERLFSSPKNKVGYTILRPRLIVGPGRLGLLSILFDWISKDKNIYLIGYGGNRFQMVCVYDLIDACISSINKAHNQIINIGYPDVPKLKDVMKSLINHAKSRSDIVPINPALARISLMVLDWFKLTPLNIEHYKIADKDFVLDVKKAKKLLGWKPKYNHEQMLSLAYDWYRENKAKLQGGVASDAPKEGLLKIIKLFS